MMGNARAISIASPSSWLTECGAVSMLARDTCWQAYFQYSVKLRGKHHVALCLQLTSQESFLAIELMGHSRVLSAT